MIGEIVFEDGWIYVFVLETKLKSFLFSIHSKCNDYRLGKVRWHPQWRRYIFEPETKCPLELTDRCLLAVGSFIMWLNAQHKLKYKYLPLYRAVLEEE